MDTTTTSADSARIKLHAILAEHNLSQSKAADIISKETSRPLSLRAVQSWLAEPTHPSSRGCPEWAVEVLEKHMKKKSAKTKKA